MVHSDKGQGSGDRRGEALGRQLHHFPETAFPDTQYGETPSFLPPTAPLTFPSFTFILIPWLLFFTLSLPRSYELLVDRKCPSGSQ